MNEAQRFQAHGFGKAPTGPPDAVPTERLEEIVTEGPRFLNTKEHVAMARHLLHLKPEVERLREAERDYKTWRLHGEEQYRRIGAALDPLREKRHTGEPSRSDAVEVELVASDAAKWREAEPRMAMLEAAQRYCRGESGRSDGETGSAWGEWLTADLAYRAATEPDPVAGVRGKIESIMVQCAGRRAEGAEISIELEAKLIAEAVAALRKEAT